MRGPNFGGEGWGHRRRDFDNFDEGTPGPGWFGPQSWGFGPGPRGGMGPMFWGRAFRFGPRMGVWAFRRGFGPFGPGWGRGFEGPHAWGDPREGGLDAAIAGLERVQAHLERRLERVKGKLEQLRAERARQKEGGPREHGHEHGHRHGHHHGPRPGFRNAGDSSDTDPSML